jgi:tricarballylate dehydrogenase
VSKTICLDEYGELMTSTALLLLDYQVAMCDPGPQGRQPALAAQVAERQVLPRAARVLDAARRAGVFVVHVRLAFDASYELRTNRSARFDAYRDNRAMLVGSPEAEFMPEVRPLPSEPILTKAGVDPFIGTPLLEILLGRGIRHVALAGVATNLVVESAARHATDSGLAVSVLEDLCASFDPEMHAFAVARTLPIFATVTTSAQFLAAVAQTQTQAQAQAQARPRPRRRAMSQSDVVIVGAGIAGLSAALSASEAGAHVTVIDRAPAAASGGNTRYTEAFLRMKSTDEPADDLADSLLSDFQGHPDPGLLVDTLRDRAHWDGPTTTLNIVDQDLVARLVEQAGPTLSWLSGFGVSFAALPTPFPTTSTSRISPVGGGLALVEALTDAAQQRGVVFLFETTARSLIARDGAVTGVRALSEQGRLDVRGQVVLACGGYEGNTEMLARYHGEKGMLCRPVARGGHYNKGEGIEMALAAGAATAGNFGLFHAEPIDPRSGEPEAAIFAFPYGILVNAEGERFTDEAPGPADAWYERITRRIQAQTRGVGYLILDAAARDVPRLALSIRTDQPPIVGADLDDLARRLDLPITALRRTVEAFNAACVDGEFDPARPDGLATAGVEPAKSNWARPVTTGPLHAYPIIAANVFTFGGLRTTADAEVLDRDGRPIPGLYAAGELTGLYYSNYTGSTSVLRGAVFGRIGGRHAAGALTAATAAVI